jgi:hypothetical protein
VAPRTGPSWVRAARLSESELARRGIGVAEEIGRDDPLWPGQLAMLAGLLLYVALPSKLTIGPDWLVPAAEALLLVALVVPALLRAGHVKLAREAVLTLLAVGTLVNLVSLGLLTHYLVIGGHTRGANLIDGGAIIWCTNLLLFTVWYWELDRGGPPRTGASRPPVAPDFLFPQMSDDRYAAPGWKPHFGDYLYVSLTNQSAFSPTDTMPLTPRMKLLMGIQGIAAFITVGIIVARAVNILG